MRRKSTSQRMFSLGSLLQKIAKFGARYQGNQHKAELDQLKAENLALKNGQESNKVLKGDLEIELLNLKIAEMRARLAAKGIGSDVAPFSPTDTEKRS